MIKTYSSLDNQNIVDAISTGAIGIIPTDTIYGLITLAENPTSVQKLYDIRGRDPKKPSIILISNIGQLPNISEKILTEYQRLNSLHPTTIVVDTDMDFMPHLPKQNKTLAFRLVNQPALRWLIERTGPIIAPSANLEGQPASNNILEAKKYFGDKIDFYVDGGDLSNRPPSTIIGIKPDNSIVTYRQSAIKTEGNLPTSQ